MPYHPRPYQFYEVTLALFTECLERVDAKIVFENMGRRVEDERRA